MASAEEVWLWLLLVMQPHNNRLNYILSQCDYDAKRAATAIRDGAFPFISDEEKRRAEQVRLGAVRQIQQVCRENNVSIITFDSEDYPFLLRQLGDPPYVLFSAGSLAGLEKELCVTVVGTRNVSDYGKKVTSELSGQLAKMGGVIISGLAVGADTAAHEACLEKGGRTIGVLGCGILVNYPQENAGLKRRIVDNGGAVVSELLPYTKSSPLYFHIRNRILSGLSPATLVTECPEKSGCMITANLACEQGREVFVVPPHDILNSRYAGAVQLLRDGAQPAFGASDIVAELLKNGSAGEYLIDLVGELEKSKKPPAPPKSPAKKKKNSAEKGSESAEDKENIENNEKAGEGAPEKPIFDENASESLTPNEKTMLDLVFEKASSMDELLLRSGLSYADAAEALTCLEIYGYIFLNKDGTYTRS